MKLLVLCYFDKGFSQVFYDPINCHIFPTKVKNLTHKDVPSHLSSLSVIGCHRKLVVPFIV